MADADRQQRRSHRLRSTLLAGSLSFLPLEVEPTSKQWSFETRPRWVAAAARAEVNEAAAVYRRVTRARPIPPDVIECALAVAVFGNSATRTSGDTLTARNGVLLRRLGDDAWGAPVFVTLTTRSVDAVEALVLIMEPSALEALAAGEVRFAVRHSAIAGQEPVNGERLPGTASAGVLVHSNEESRFPLPVFTGARVSLRSDLNNELYGSAARSLLNGYWRSGPRLRALADAISESESAP